MCALLISCVVLSGSANAKSKLKIVEFSIDTNGKVSHVIKIITGKGYVFFTENHNQ